ncbi:bifunctional riboflavin kinase/FAD synthetase [Synechococcus sp. RSCCF101]|uniref:bifunctional riboflavin kinase/FAD synthetase n=1 Tax=Synechococcus sp. RSCCF101 TaxID=2511069 RepID=UPI00124413F2|nr:bifunctional riboflavin kinase/FAD synthetase [Synechococcus sp. RSCCF101]QEY31949.1 bifunctional riboflavin kinase/FAD synthetase [Synechococcus sp. RSCCF101]
MIPLCSPDAAQRPTAVALGSFDGLHAGHRAVIEAICPGGPGRGEVAAEAVPTVVSFWPHPREVLQGEVRLRLDLPSEKLELLEPLGVRQLVLVPFTEALSRLTPEAFVRSVLQEQLRAVRVAVGANFRFGRGRAGDSGTLAELGRDLGIAVEVVPLKQEGDVRLSSSRIRRALACGDLAAAARLLERPYRFSGSVTPGRGLGRTIGWPTANLRIDGRKCLPMQGVYAVRVWLESGAEPEGPLPGVMNLGPQPTVDPTAPSAVEVHLLGRSIDLAGCSLRVEPVALLRQQVRFSGMEELGEQIRADAAAAERILSAGL